MYRDFVERDSAYELLADAYLEKGDKTAASRRSRSIQLPAGGSLRH